MFIIATKKGNTIVFDDLQGATIEKADLDVPARVEFLFKNGETREFYLKSTSSEYLEDAVIRGFKTNEYFKEV